MLKRYFITGTDTNCGKTRVACQLLAYWNARGQKAQALKPVASGCSVQNGKLVNEDTESLQGCNYLPGQRITRWMYEPPIAPHLAARLAGDELSAAGIADFCDSFPAQELDYLLVEGAGGLVVPLNARETWIDFLKITGMPVILVVGMRLGCINHALLTGAVLQLHDMPCSGWIANQIDENMLMMDESIDTLRARLPMPLIATVGYGGEIEVGDGL